MIISEVAVQKVKSDYTVIGLLMGAFDRGEKTIASWLESKDVRLTTPTAVEIIKKHTGLTEDEIVVSEQSKEPQN